MKIFVTSDSKSNNLKLVSVRKQRDRGLGTSLRKLYSSPSDGAGMPVKEPQQLTGIFQSGKITEKSLEKLKGALPR